MKFQHSSPNTSYKFTSKCWHKDAKFTSYPVYTSECIFLDRYAWSHTAMYWERYL